jgi:hypothetical protein
VDHRLDQDQNHNQLLKLGILLDLLLAMLLYLLLGLDLERGLDLKNRKLNLHNLHLKNLNTRRKP